MVEVFKEGIFLYKGREILKDTLENQGRIKSLGLKKDEGRKGTIASRIITAHSSGGDDKNLHLKFDALASHDITYVNIIQTAKVSGLKEFPVPYVLTNCHNSLCAVGGTINEDDHRFGLQAAKRYGGIFVPPHLAVIHSYLREEMAACGKMILGSDSHTRFGSLGCMGVGEGGGELVKQLLGRSYEMAYPRVIAVYLSGKPRPGVGPQDAALAIIGAVFKDGFVKNACLEFVGDGIANLPADYRAGIDAMTTETSCWSSIWETDSVVKDYLIKHNREKDFTMLCPKDAAYYDGLIKVDLSTLKPMIALPFHPSNVCELDALLANPADMLRQVEKDTAELIENPNIKLKLTDKVTSDGRIRVDQAVVAGCAGGTTDNIMAVHSIFGGHSSRGGEGNEGFTFSIYPGSQSVLLELGENGALAGLLARGVIVKTAFCGPCFGAGDVPANNALSIRHTTRNFPNREGSKPSGGQISSVCLMDARSIAATALAGGYLSSAENLDYEEWRGPYSYPCGPYIARVYNGAGKPDKNAELIYGPNISDWPPMDKLGNNLLLKIVSYITDPVTTTDELIPSGETSSYRSNPLGLAEFTLSRKDPLYVGKAKKVKAAAESLKNGADGSEGGGADSSEGGGAAAFLPELPQVLKTIKGISGMSGLESRDLQLGSAIFAKKPGDGSAREQAASCQRVLGGLANFACEYATKRYRSNLINWGILPFVAPAQAFENGSYVFIPGISEKIRACSPVLDGWVISPSGGEAKALQFTTPLFTGEERDIILEGCLINFNRTA
ncbi:MAG: hydratase [Treponema sp.]|jgi:aconitate hydratase|nr:hydratase [Treponema sp.]